MSNYLFDQNELEWPQNILSEHQNRLVEQGRFADAERLLQAWLQHHNDEPHADIVQLELARLAFWQGHLFDAKTILDDLIQRCPDQSWAFSFLGQVESRFGNHERSESLFRHALDLNPENHESQKFLSGDLLSQTKTVRQLLTHRAPSPRQLIEICELCLAVDHKRRQHFEPEEGEITQASFNRMNVLMDLASPGDPVDRELSLWSLLLKAKQVVYYTSTAFGDTILGMTVVDAFARLFDMYPEAWRPIDVVTPFGSIFKGIEERYTHTTIHSAGPGQGDAVVEYYLADLRRRSIPTLVFCNAGVETYSRLQQAGAELPAVLGTVDLFIDRIARDLSPWRCLSPPFEYILTYSARLHRFMEIILGTKLLPNPTQVRANFELSQALAARAPHDLAQLGLCENAYDVVIESASKRAKMFDPDQLADLLIGMIRKRTALAPKGAVPIQLVFSKDLFSPHSFVSRIPKLPRDIRDRIIIVEKTFDEMTTLLALSASVVSVDTGLAHLASALGCRTLILTTMADPYLWSTGQPRTKVLASRHALAAHDSLTPVNMIEWEGDQPVTMESFTTREIIEAWSRLNDDDYPIKRSPTGRP